MPLSIGQIIKKLRKERNLTQEELAEQLNVTYQAISKWENETGMPDISQIIPLASVFGVSTDILFGTSEKNDTDEVRELLDNVYRTNENHKIDAKKCYFELQDGLRKFPNNIWLLANCLEMGQALAYPESELYDETCSQDVYVECIRMANIVISYSKEITDVLRAHMIMVTLHSAYGNYEKAREHANKFPWRSDFTIHHMNAFISYFEKDYVNSANHSRENVRFSLEALAGAMMQQAYAYEYMKRNDYALVVYNKVKKLVELFPNDEHFSTPTVWTEWGQLDDLIKKCSE